MIGAVGAGFLPINSAKNMMRRRRALSATLCFHIVPALTYLLVAPMRLHGKPLEQQQIRTATPVRANVVVSHQNLTVLGVTIVTADPDLL